MENKQPQTVWIPVKEVTPYELHDNGNGMYFMKPVTGILLTVEEYAEKDREIERLKGLMKEGFVLLQREWGKFPDQIEKDWGKFKRENNIL